MTTLDLKAYCARIGYSGSMLPDLATLRGLHAAHAAAIPFEGLDPFCRRPVRLDFASLHDKIIVGRRGGYCFEQNALFQAALGQIGFAVTGLAARVRWMSPPESPLGPREHMTLKVDLPEGAFLADVGFGACVMDAPLKLQPGVEQKTAMGRFLLDERDGLFTLSARQPDGWRTMYVFDLTPQIAADYELGNYYTSTHPATPFPNIVIMERVDESRRYKLINKRFIIEGPEGEIREQRELDAPEWEATLENVFGVTPPEPAQALFARLPDEIRS